MAVRNALLIPRVLGASPIIFPHLMCAGSLVPNCPARTETHNTQSHYLLQAVEPHAYLELQLGTPVHVSWSGALQPKTYGRDRSRRHTDLNHNNCACCSRAAKPQSYPSPKSPLLSGESLAATEHQCPLHSRSGFRIPLKWNFSPQYYVPNDSR